MSVVNILKDCLFGSRLKAEDEFFGQMQSERRRSASVHAEITWYIDYRFPFFREETFIIIEGNRFAPDKARMEALKNFITSFQTVHAQQLDRLIAADSSYGMLTGWRDSHYIGSIINSMEEVPAFEIEFEPYEDGKSFWLDYRSGSLKNLQSGSY